MTPFPTPLLLPDPPMCSYNTCTNGHKWPPEITVASCPDCKTPILATRMIQCPVCNEPIASTTIQTQHLSSGMRMLPVCNPESTVIAEIPTITLSRKYAPVQLELPFDGD